MLRQPNDIGTNRRAGKGQVGIDPFMKFAMAVSERKGARIPMVYGGTIIDERSIGSVLKIAIVKGIGIFVQVIET